MKCYNMTLLVLLLPLRLLAQQASPGEEELTKEQKWFLEKTKQFYTAANLNMSAKGALRNMEQLLAANLFCQASNAPAASIQVEGERLNDQSIVVRWDVIGEAAETRYIVERRYENTLGAFDSIGMIEGRATKAPLQSYQFRDDNNYPGPSFYRVRQQLKGTEQKEMVKVKGYENRVKVVPNPAITSAIQIAVERFRTDAPTTVWITDAKGSTIYQVEKAFANNTSLLKLPNLRLPKGSYRVYVSNKINTGSTTFLIQ